CAEAVVDRVGPRGVRERVAGQWRLPRAPPTCPHGRWAAGSREPVRVLRPRYGRSIPEAVRDDLTGKAWDVGVGAGAHGPDFLCPRPVQHCTTGVSITLCDASAEGDQSGA